jgi:hypothetical protein
MSNDLLPQVTEFNIMKDLARISVNSGLLPTSINSPEKALIIMLKGREIGVPTMQAFSHIHVVNGKPTMSAELMLTQIYKCIPKVVINYIQSDDKCCIIEVQRPNCDKTKWSFSIQEAEKAQLLSKGPWKQYPAAMLRARAISIMARAQFPDCLNGISYTAEELGAEIDFDDNGCEVIKDVTKKIIAKPTDVIQNKKPIESLPQVKEPITSAPKIEVPKVNSQDEEFEKFKEQAEKQANEASAGSGLDSKPETKTSPLPAAPIQPQQPPPQAITKPPNLAPQSNPEYVPQLFSEFQDYEMKSGRYAGIELGKIHANDLRKYLQSNEEYAIRENIVLPESVQENIFMIKNYLGMPK